MKNAVTLLAVVGTCASAVLAQNFETQTLPGPYNLSGTGIGTLASTSFTAASASATRLAITGTLQTVLPTSLPNEVYIYVTAPAGEEFAVRPSLSTTAGGVTINFASNTLLPADVTTLAGTWSLRLADTVNSGVGTDSILSNLSLTTTNDAVPIAATVNPVPDGSTTITAQDVAAAEVKWVKLVLTSGIDAAVNNYCDIITTAGGDTEIGLYRNDGTLVASDDDGLPGALSILTFGTGETQAAPSNGNDGSLTAGTYWLAFGRFNITFGAADFAAVGTTGPAATIDLEIRKGTFVPPPDLPAPAGTIAVGTLGNGVYSNTSDYAITEFKWFSFTTPVAVTAAGDKYVDIWTVADAYLGANQFQNDTEIGLYKANGLFIFGNDEATLNTSLSAITIGNTAAPRTTGDINDAALDGFDVASLAAGNYYLAVGGWNMNFGAGLAVTSTGDDAGPVTVKIGSNFAPTCTCCNLSNVAGPNQSTTPDDVLTADDIIVFLGWFFANDARANVAGANQSTIPDNVLTADDIIVFLGRYFAGC